MNCPDESVRPLLFPVTCACAVTLFVVMTALSYVLWDQPAQIMWVPAYALQWGFCGGMVAILYRLAVLRGGGLRGDGLYAWVVAKPVMGTVLGGLVYLVACCGELALNSKTTLTKYEFLSAVAFLGGFSDRFSIQALGRLAGKWTEEGERSSIPASDQGSEAEPILTTTKPHKVSA